jgi:hypothetical protein
MDEEIWKDVIGFEGYYSVSNFGRVKSLGRGRCPACERHGKPERILRQAKNKKTGYHAVSMSKPGMGAHKVVVWPIHRLVAVHFVDGRTEERWWVNHKDSDRSNNRDANLEWATPGENSRHMHKKGRWKRIKFTNPWPTRRANMAKKKLAA